MATAISNQKNGKGETVGHGCTEAECGKVLELEGRNKSHKGGTLLRELILGYLGAQRSRIRPSVRLGPLLYIELVLSRTKKTPNKPDLK